MVVGIDFIFSVYDDRPLVERLVIDLQRIYPESKLICIADGADVPGFAQFAAERGITYVVGETRLKPAHNGGLWLERMLKTALKYSTGQHIVRADGDLKVWRRFKYLPSADISGAIHKRHGFAFPNGSCQIMKRSAIEAILASGVLQDSLYATSPEFAYERYGEYRHADEDVDLMPMSLDDVILGHVVQRLGLSLAPFWDCDIQFRGEPHHNADLKYAATHPVR